MAYLWLKTAHMVLATVSISGFLLRGAGRLGGRSWVRRRWVRIAPHVIDTLFLVSGVTLAWILGASPLNTDWLAAKIAGLVAYILLGILAFRGRRRGLRVVSFVLALAAFGYVVLVAFSKRPGIWI
ncbi:MAG: SirB2 family protein [Xanthomonadales bacterium]|nr:SirB2 family protein [Xanthomonadales bacterium]